MVSIIIAKNQKPKVGSLYRKHVKFVHYPKWYVNEIRDLLDNPVFCRHVAVLFGFGNQLVGDHAEHFIGKHLVNAYQLFDQCPTSYFVDLYQ